MVVEGVVVLRGGGGRDLFLGHLMDADGAQHGPHHSVFASDTRELY